jgi:arginyl-tRNA synthetase
MVMNMNFFHNFREEILKAIENLVQSGSLPEGLDVEKITTEPPRDPAHGDLATNAAMVLAKTHGEKSSRVGRTHQKRT